MFGNWKVCWDLNVLRTEPTILIINGQDNGHSNSGNILIAGSHFV